ncbi:MAG TPA: NAD(P)/FAD-dependent oxidoreductase [bacterium]|mgnify:CR=1 FL=1|nr:NAD(P)/FAD-dependent oxidoreductase [bacterium]HPN42070.1 NAD(P)/FAD-dependent oxidoreductase [bacterium]
MKDRYDVIVVGGGPSGSMAAMFAARAGVSVLMLEKDREIGLPVRCAEGVGDKGLRSVVDINPNWIAQKITTVKLISPAGMEVVIGTDEVGYILNRKMFDPGLAELAAQAGSEIITKAYVNGLLLDNNKVTGVRVRTLGREFQVKASIVIGADGVESRVGRWAGIKTWEKLNDMETCAQVTAQNINVQQDAIHLYFSNTRAPKGYLWVFPKGNGLANVGIGISGEASRHKSPFAYLFEFLQTNFPQAAIITTVAGGVPCAREPEKIVANGLMLVGDAARQVNPVSGGGIVTGMIAGKIAGQVAGQAIIDGKTDEKRLAEYARLWQKAEGKKHKVFYKLKEFVYNMSDKDLDDTAKIALQIPQDKRTILQLFKTALVQKPALILEAIKVLT